MIKITRTKNKKMECSKRILVVSYTCAILLTLIVIVGTFMNYDMSNVTTIAALAWGEVAVSNAFYYNKAKSENKIKIASSLTKKTGQEIDINNLLN